MGLKGGEEEECRNWWVCVCWKEMDLPATAQREKKVVAHNEK